ncbi:MAG: AmmeMemoRadiSam system radical SAM enzyme [Fervidicoccaceae archaeon]
MGAGVVAKAHVREAMYWRALSEGRVECGLCYRRCVIAPDRYGVCGVRKNTSGKLYTLVYGLLTAVNVDPIEKKPLYHFKPGSEVLSISTVGCNFFCSFCQNYEISQSRLEEGLYGVYHEPEDVVKLAKRYGARGISYTYNEPVVFYEYMLDVAKLAKRSGLFNTMVTNGYLELEPAEELSKYMDAATVDFKGGANPNFYRGYMSVPDPSPIFQTAELFRERGVFVEITNLVVPRLGDKVEDVRKLARWVADQLGPETPFHLLRFHPDYKMLHIPPTPTSTLERLAEEAARAGLKHVYLGNVWDHELENTYCPSCGAVVIKRRGFYANVIGLDPNGRCVKCGYKLNVIM